MEPWNLKEDDTRLADSLPTFIIFCEDEVSEPVYFKYFETPLIKVNPVEGQKSKIENVFKAITHCISEELMDVVNGLHILKNAETQVWCVFDRDIEEIQAHQILGNTSFDESIETAKNRGLKVAWSNDSFELWILLHFEDVDLSKNKSRVEYYSRLTSLFKALPNPNEELTKALGIKGFSYEKDLKRKKNFRAIVRSAIVSKTLDAVKRARKIEEAHADPPKPNHQNVPCTLVHHLVEELIRLGGKKIEVPK